MKPETFCNFMMLFIFCFSIFGATASLAVGFTICTISWYSKNYIFGIGFGCFGIMLSAFIFFWGLSITDSWLKLKKQVRIKNKT